MTASQDLAAGRFDLGGGFLARPLLPSESAPLAAAFAAMEPWRRYPSDAAELEAYATQVEPGAPRLAIVAGEHLAGLVGVRWTWLRGPYLQFLGVLPAFQQQGAGSAVLRWLEREAAARGEENLFVCVSDFNAPAHRFYETHGFRKVGTLPHLVKHGFTEILLRRQL
jgi:ribosomal protein S18 acetylase RimI-like enzyme